MFSHMENMSEPAQGFVIGHSTVKPQTRHTPPEAAEAQESTDTLCLSRTNLTQVSECVFRDRAIKYLYLEGNQISSVPDSLFISLPNLLWLDLRNNQIASLPAEIGLHRCLKTLLLEGNPISELPPELGNVITLKGLNLRNCPISFPPQDIVHEGLQSILHYLRSALAERPISTRKTPPELPVVEKLQLSELTGSSTEEQDESVDEEELQKFEELKFKMGLLDRAELNSIQERKDNPKSPPPPLSRRKKATTRASVIPELHLFDSQHWKRLKVKRQTAINELKDKQALLEQKRKKQEALQKSHTQAKVTHNKQISKTKPKKHERPRKEEEASADSGLEDSSDSPRIPSTFITEWDNSRSSRLLEQRVRARIELIQERAQNPTGTDSEQRAATLQDVEEVRKLQALLLERKQNRGRDLKKHVTNFSADTWQSFLHI
ncbi:uncharacterized protein V6R79_009875 [Siganus canaliculatus]